MKNPVETIAPSQNNRKFHRVGGRIASMAAAAFLICDGAIAGRQITIIEESNHIRGRLSWGFCLKHRLAEVLRLGDPIFV
jgi:myosin-crossreactive antigen